MSIIHYATEPTESEEADPDFIFSPGWYFWDETQADRIGPFDTEQHAKDTLDEYCHWLSTGKK